LKHATIGRKRGPGYPPVYPIIAHALSALGRSDEAAARIVDLLDYSPKFTMQTPAVQVAFPRVPQIRARHLDYLRAAGLPEGN
jgi:hypothetical protein